jgi:hypothetical protein
LAPELSAADLPDVPVLAEGDERGLLARLERIQLVGVVRQYAGEPARSGHPLLREHLLVAIAEGISKNSWTEDQKPSRSVTDHWRSCW